MTTIRDIARHAGVSPATVSRVINGGSVRESTRTRVESAIAECGYVPDSRAASLRRRDDLAVGLLIPDIANPFYPGLVKAFHRRLHGTGRHLLLGDTDGSAEEERTLLERFLRERVGGIVLCLTEGEDDASLAASYQRIATLGIPLVCIDRIPLGARADRIGVRNGEGAFAVTEYLLRTGRRRIAFLAAHRGLRAVEDRLRGYREALAAAGIAPATEPCVFQGEYTDDYGQPWAERMLEEVEPDALVCGNDLLAIGALRAAEARGLRVPEDVAITGYDDVPAAQLVRPRLTTIRIGPARMASAACDCLEARLEDRLPPEMREVWLEPELIVRESA